MTVKSYIIYTRTGVRTDVRMFDCQMRHAVFTKRLPNCYLSPALCDAHHKNNSKNFTYLAEIVSGVC
jgi:hypothetical protein